MIESIINQIEHLLANNSKSVSVYQVGGSVRDELLDIKPKDVDYVVVGAEKRQLQELGLIQVGKAFPCFIDPKTKTEFALARTETKSGKGYYGFECDYGKHISLYQDLKRRDLTINAMAKDKNGHIIDPFNGQKDLDQRLLRHTSQAFVEDPLRVLRVARFLAKLHHRGFTVAKETIALMKTIVTNGELQYLAAERVWQETQSALCETSPEQFFILLKEIGALAIIFPEIDRLYGVAQPAKYHPEIDTGIHTMMVLQRITQLTDDPKIRFAALTHDLGKGVTPKDQLPSHRGHEKAGVPIIEALCKRLRTPRSYQKLAVKVSEYHLHCHKALELRATTIVVLIKALNGLRNPEFFSQFLLVCKSDAQGRKGLEHIPYPQADYLKHCLSVCLNVDIEVLKAKGYKGKKLGNVIEEQQRQAIEQLRSNYGHNGDFKK